MPDSSPDTEAVEAEDQGVTTAEAPAAEGDKETILDAVKASLNTSEEAPASVETGNDTTGAESDDTDEGDGEGEEADPLQLTDAEKKVLSQRAQDRFHSLAQRAKDAESKTEALTPKAEQFDKLTGYLRQNGISDQDFNNTVEVTRLIRNDPDKAYPVVLNILQHLATRTGRALSPELQERIRLGHISEEDARKLSQAEGRAKLVEERTREEQQAKEQENAQRQWETQVSTATTAVDEWAKTQAATDPDWSLKMPYFEQALELELRRGGVERYPKNAQEAVDLAKRAVEQVNKSLKKLRPKSQPKAPPSNEGSSPRGQAEPETAVEAAKQALANMSAG